MYISTKNVHVTYYSSLLFFFHLDFTGVVIAWTVARCRDGTIDESKRNKMKALWRKEEHFKTAKLIVDDHFIRKKNRHATVQLKGSFFLHEIHRGLARKYVIWHIHTKVKKKEKKKKKMWILNSYFTYVNDKTSIACNFVRRHPGFEIHLIVRELLLFSFFFKNVKPLNCI